MSAFQCVGGACEETCCADFRVDIDKPTFEKYAAVQDPALGQTLKAFVQKRSDRSIEAFAEIVMTPSGECPFLDAHRLCAIQGALGEAALSHTCRSFPRARWTRDGAEYLGGKLSCPEAARLCVSAPDAMDFPAGQPTLAASTAGGAVHVAVESALRDGDLPAWKGILFAILVSDRCLPDEVAAAASGEAELSVVRDFAAQTRRELSEATFALGDQTLLQLKLLIEIALAASAKCNAARNRFPHIVQTALGAIFAGADDFDGAVANYRRLYRDRFVPFDGAHDHALRNYLLNYVFTNQTFLSGPALPQAQNLAVRYGIMRLLLVGLSGVRTEGLTIADYGAVVSAASRILDHDATISPEICRVLDAIEPRSVSLAARMAIPPL